MCGLTGVYAFNEQGKVFFPKIAAAVNAIIKRGPDSNGEFIHNNVALGHVRLSIIDVSDAASQPFSDESGRYTIVYNGEIFNYLELRETLLQKGIKFRSHSDTEVLLYLYISEGAAFLKKLNGFFAFAIYDKVEGSFFIARDRMGIKPLLVYNNENAFLFASEMKAMLAYGIPKELDYESIYTYLQLNYIPSPYSIFKNVYKLQPGTYLEIKNNTIKKEIFYEIPFSGTDRTSIISYEAAQKELLTLLDESVKRRLVADVPLGAFLSGGIDSSVVVALASRYADKLNTFSIGYKDEPLFDETKYAELVANKFRTNHTVFKLTNDDLFANLHKVLDYTDEPYADSSALAVNILSMHTRKHVTVALSGDGADELFSGYLKHSAEYRLRKGGLLLNFIKWGTPLFSLLPQSRNTSFGNLNRQIVRFGKGMRLDEKERYWRWCGYRDELEAENLMLHKPDKNTYNHRKAEILKHITPKGSFNEVLYTDMHLVLQNDMLVKVDMMSMENALEVRVPFLDYTVVDFAFGLPVDYKIRNNYRKCILQDSFRTILPEELYQRPKHGFEVPLLKWFSSELKSMITDDLLSDGFIEEQGLFSHKEIMQLKNKVFSSNPGDSVAQMWGLIVLQYWWEKYYL
jgi:asparagine synthase (glutamine-hydrolysing)